MKELAEVIKIFLEKQLLPTIISIIIAIFALIITPDDFFILLKIGSVLYFILTFTIPFLLIVIIINIFNSKEESFLYLYHIAAQDVEAKNKRLETIDRIQSYIDTLSIEDRNLLYDFIKNNNTPIIIADNHCTGDCILNNCQLVHSQIVMDTNSNSLIRKKQYILRDVFFRVLKSSLEKYGRISHFN